MKEQSMYYKLLNKTLLTSALVSLIFFNANSVQSQGLVTLEDDEFDISLPAPNQVKENKAPALQKNENNDVIPLDNGLIVPQNPASPKAPKEAKAPSKSDFNQDSDILFVADSIPAPAEERALKKVDKDAPKAPAKAAPQTENPKTNAPAKAVAPNAPKNAGPQKRPEQKAQPQKAQPKAPQAKPAQNADALKFGDSILAQTNNDLFNQMSDIEKQTTLLTLELKREKIQNEVEAAKAVRERAEQEKIAQEEAKKRKEIEWQKEQEAKVIREQTALKQKELELEKLKQRKALTAYMNSMLEQKQAWVGENAKLYDEIKTLKEANKKIRESYKDNLDKISIETKKLAQNAETAKSNHDRTVASLTAQNAQLKKRIEADAAAAKNGGRNPFSNTQAAVDSSAISTSADALIKPINISKEYAIMEITGKGDELFVTLINKAGDTFVAKTGTVLQTGHIIEEITPSYVQFDRNGLKDFLYTTSSALSTEPEKMGKDASANASQKQGQAPRANLISEQSVPSVADSMFVK